MAEEQSQAENKEAEHAAPPPAGKLDEATAAKVKRQVEFYFSDSNLPKDKFLLAKAREDPDGFVNIGLVSSFARMRTLLALPDPKDGASAIEVPPEAVAKVAAVLRTSTELTVSEDGTRVKRANALPSRDEIAAAVEERSLYVTPFSLDITIDGLTEFFSQQGSVRSIRLRRHAHSKDFRGSIFVEFASAEEANKVLQAKLEYQGAELRMEPKKDFLVREGVERDSFFDSAVDADDKAAQMASEKKAEGDEAGTADAEGNDDDVAYEPGVVVEFEITGEELENIGWQAIKDLASKHGLVKYVDYQQGGSKGHVRYEDSESAKKAVAATSEGVDIGEKKKLKFNVITGDAEKEYWRKTRQLQQKRRDHFSDQKRRGGYGYSGAMAGGAEGSAEAEAGVQTESAAVIAMAMIHAVPKQQKQISEDQLLLFDLRSNGDRCTEDHSFFLVRLVQLF
eukprot:jgi/Chlat1/361/Chrsp10S01483